MTTLIIILLLLAIVGVVAREFVWMDRLKEQGWKHNDLVKSLESEANDLAAENLTLAQENEELEAWGREAITAVTEATKMVVEANGRVKAATSG